jgi:rubredoxin
VEKYECPCCGYLTLDEKPPGTFAICPVCFWEDDDFQFNHPDYAGGVNKISLNQCKLNFRLFGASSKDVIKHVRKPLDSELKH